MRIGIVAPGGRLDQALPARIQQLLEDLYPDGSVELIFHPQCFLSWGHFAGPDQVRAAAFLEFANEPGIDALWVGRGGYGSCRLVERILSGISQTARNKLYLGYSDAGTLLAALYGRGFPRLAHGPMPIDITRQGGEAAVARALAYLIKGDPSTIEPSVGTDGPALAFNITILSQMLGTPWQPDVTGHVIQLEEVSEYMYRIDRSLCHITSNPGLRQAAGLRLGRWSDIPANDPDFGQTAEEVIRHWCDVSGLPYLGRADIGHDIDNKIVPFGPIATV